MKGNRITATILLLIAVVICYTSGQSFLAMHTTDTIIPGAGVTEIRMLSSYFPELEGTNGDTEIYVLKGEAEGGSMLILGGTHPNEPAAYITAVTVIENALIEQGTVYVIPRANNSAFTHNDPQEGSPQYYILEGKSGERRFTFGSRATNPIDQWPDPDVYIHSSGQQLSGSETRNLNRGYPGRIDGTFTEKIAYGIAEFVRQESIDVTVDLHEASPEYPVINAMVSHERAMTLASKTVIDLEMNGIPMGLEPSPYNLHGLSHRELGSFTDTLAVLMETANAAQGRLRGATDADLAITGIDDTYVKAQKIGVLYVPYDEKGHPIESRVGRHLSGIVSLSKNFTSIEESKPIVIVNLPTYEEITSLGMQSYLN